MKHKKLPAISSLILSPLAMTVVMIPNLALVAGFFLLNEGRVPAGLILLAAGLFGLFTGFPLLFFPGVGVFLFLFGLATL